MPLSKSLTHQNSVDRFWDNNLFVLKKNATPKNSIAWYRKHAEAYIKVYKNTPINSQTGEDIDCYLNAKGRLPELEEWQFRQLA